MNLMKTKVKSAGRFEKLVLEVISPESDFSEKAFAKESDSEPVSEVTGKNTLLTYSKVTALVDDLHKNKIL